MPEGRGQIIVIDDDEGNRRSTEMALRRDGYGVVACAGGEEGLEVLRAKGADLLVTDLRMPGLNGLEVLRRARAIDPGIGVLVITGFGSVESAVDAMKQGADDYLQKPVNLVELRKRVAAAVEKRRLAAEVANLRERLEEKFSFGKIIGAAPSMQQVLHQLQLVAPTRSSVLIVGESGTGKELIANALHQHSPRKESRFVAVNCAAIPPDILESEMFGHERGAFTGAVQRKIGTFELADRGTLFLDEISELPLALQAKLLRVLEERSFMRVGGTETIHVDARILAATNADLEARVAAGTFRSDLYYRLKVVTIFIPPLRERPEDIPLLAHRFFATFKEENGRHDLLLDDDAVAALNQPRWDGNVRELRNLMESLVVLAPPGATRVTVADLPEDYRAPAARPQAGQGAASAAGATAGAAAGAAGSPGGPARTMDAIEREAILRALDETGGNRTRAAEMLGIGLRTLQRKLKEYGQGSEDGAA
ncbi:MAG TPA: sigma-54 dependent transcriptional regulator [Candidatus Polarisedimenticolia bacterium]|jgi:DNA-binding NtrC family response regulator|nr:sigma-54 dependent transcriptional regulator [Candidatus Polarisedimenticolia bacterium]